MAYEETFDDLWEQALDEYFTDTDRTHIEQKLFKRLKSPDDLQRELDTELGKFTNFRARHARLLSTVQKVVRPFVMLSSLASAAISSSPYAPASIVFGAFIFVVKAAKGVSEAFDWIEQLFQKLGSFTSRLEQYLEAGISAHLRSKVVQILACLLEILACTEKVIRNGRWKKFGAVLFLGHDERVSASFDNLASLFEDEQRLVIAINYATNRKVYDSMEEVKQTSKSTLEALQKVEAEVLAMQQKERLDEVLDWISPTTFMAQHSDYLDQRQFGTGQWFFNHHKFQDWMIGSKEILFCPGLPGAGKTTMAAAIVERLLKMTQSEDFQIGIAYIYCDYKQRAFQSTKSILAAILRQLVQSRRTIPDSISKLYNEKGKLSGWQHGDIQKALKVLLKDYQRAFVVIDALDECIDPSGNRIQRDLLDQIKCLQVDSNLNLLVTSRSNPDIEKSLQDAPRLQIQAHKGDIMLFAHAQLHRQPIFANDSHLQKAVENEVADAAGGMFLLAKLNIQWLREMTTKKEVKKALQKISKSHEPTDNAFEVYRQAYDRTIQRIEAQSPSHRKLALNGMAWITFAQRPLKTKELLHALAIEIGEVEFDEDNLTRVEVLISACMGLVTVDEESQVVRLVHYTMQGYLEQIRSDWIPEAEAHIASACLSYLSFKPFRLGSCGTDLEFLTRLRQHVFLDYAARYWMKHTKRVEHKVCKLACSFLAQGGSVSSAYQAGSAFKVHGAFASSAHPHQTALALKTHRPKVWPRPLAKNFLGIHFAAAYGLLVIAKQLLQDLTPTMPDYVNARDSFLRTPLELAAMNAHYAMVELLLANGADIDCDPSASVASDKARETEAQMSSQESTEVRVSGWYFTALVVASYYGHAKVVQLLLDKGADVNVSGWYGTALQAASHHGHCEIVQILLHHDADVNADGWHFGTALQAAAEHGHAAIVAMLLQKGADVTARGWYGTALQAALKFEQDKVVQLLEDHGAQLAARIDDSSSPHTTKLPIASHYKNSAEL